LHKAIGKNLYCIFVNNGLLRKNEFENVLHQYKDMGLNVKGVDASARFMSALDGVEDPETKRKAIGKAFIEVFDEEAHRIEDVNTLAGQIVTLSFYAKVNTGTKSVTPRLIQDMGSGGSGGSLTNLTAQTLTTSWQRFTITTTLPSLSGGTVGTSSYLRVDLTGGNSGTITYSFANLQLEAGSTATAFQTATGTIQGELAACQRYLPSIRGQYSTLDGFFGSTTSGTFNYNFPVEARVAPTGITVSNVADWGLVTPSVNVGATTAIAWNYGGVNGATVSTTHTAGTPTTAQNNPGILRCTGASGFILFTGCEL
jgi:hypothetical protein